MSAAPSTAVFKAIDALTEKHADDTDTINDLRDIVFNERAASQALRAKLSRAEEIMAGQAREAEEGLQRNRALRDRVDGYHAGLVRIADMSKRQISEDPEKVQHIARGLAR